MVDVLLVSSPATFSDIAPAAPAILIAMLEKAGYSAKFYDFNLIVNDDRDFIDLALNGRMPKNKKKFNNKIINYINDIKKYNPKFIGISIFTYQCQNIAKLLCVYLRIHAPEIKIILGGQGLAQGGLEGTHLGEKWKKLNLCDYWVISEGEWPIIDIVSGNYKETINWTQITNLDEFPIPNYSSYDFSRYKKTIPITGSRGCVRRCTFCDIHVHWKKFVFRSGMSIAKEMIEQSSKYGIYNFTFTDSLINGSMKAYKEMCEVLAKHNSSAKQRISWQGQFIFRPKNQMPEDVWKLSADAGLAETHVGVESLSESVRDHMKKKFSNEDIFYSLNCMKKYNITTVLLMIVGYITDNENTLQENKNMYQKLSKYSPNTIRKVAIGTTLSILPGTPLEKIAKDHGVKLGKYENDWSGPSTLETRLQWRLELIDHCRKLGFFVPENEEQQALLNYVTDQEKIYA